MRTTRPLFELDPGWLFIMGGLFLCIAGVLIPAQRDLFELQEQLATLRNAEGLGNARLRSHAEFLAELDRRNPALTRRLAASQLNILPAGDVPAILAAAEQAAVTEWIDARLAPQQQRVAQQWPETALTKLATGPRRLWVLGGGVLAVFVGLMLGAAPAASHERARRRPSDSRGAAATSGLGASDAFTNDHDSRAAAAQRAVEIAASSVLAKEWHMETAETMDSVELQGFGFEQTWDMPADCGEIAEGVGDPLAGSSNDDPRSPAD